MKFLRNGVESNKLTVIPAQITQPSTSSATNTSTADNSASSVNDASTSDTSANAPLTSYMAANGITLAADLDTLTTDNTPHNNVMDGDRLVTGEESDARRDLAVLTIKGDYVGDNGRIIYDLGKNAYQVHVEGNVSGTTTLAIQDIDAVTAAGRESFDLLIADGNIQKDSLQLHNSYVSGGVYDYITSYAGNKIKLVSYIEESKVEVINNSAFGKDETVVPTTIEALPEWDLEKNPITSTGDGSIVTTEPLPELNPDEFPITSFGPDAPPTIEPQPELDPNTVHISSVGEPLIFPELPYFNVNSVAGTRIINYSVGTLLANRRFISNLNVTPMSLTQRPGFFISIDRDSESLEFTGADYSSSYTATRTLLGNNFTLRPNLKSGIFANAATATSVIDNKVNTATGKVNAIGIGGFAQTQVGKWVEVNSAAQYLYAQSVVEGTHNQAQELHGGFAAVQVALTGIEYGNFFTFKPYLLLQAELTPTSHFVSRLGEELVTITANAWTNALGTQATLSYAGFAFEVDAYQNFGDRVTEFNSYFTQDHISATNNSYRVQTTASYQLLSNVKVSTYFNMHGSQRTSGMALDVKW